MFFRDVKHQDRALSILRRALTSGRTHHAYLFEGPEGVGKELAARALVARLLCEATNGGQPPSAGFFDAQASQPGAAGLHVPFDACGECRSCRLLAVDNHPDFHVIERALHKKHPDARIRNQKGLELVIDIVRHFLIDHAASSPALGRRRVFLIREAEKMSIEAQNCLLKTLEEPPGQTCLILVTSSAARLLPTIRSRCQLIPFGLLPPAFVREQLKMLARIDDETAAALAGLAQGRLGAALHWNRIDLLATLRDVAAALADGLPHSPENFAKRLVTLAADLVTHNVAAEKLVASASEDGEAVEDAETTEEVDDEDGEDAAEPAGGKGTAKKVATDQLRDALKLVLLTVSTVCRDALVLHSVGGSPDAPRLLPEGLVPVDRIASRWNADALADAIRAIVDAERLIDRNVAPQLACERLAIALTGEAAHV